MDYEEFMWATGGNAKEIYIIMYGKKREVHIHLR